MIWDHYIPLAVAGVHPNDQAERQGSTILDFAGMNQQRISGDLDSIVLICVNSVSRHLLVNIDSSILMDLVGRFQEFTPTPFGGAVPLGLDFGAPSLVPVSTGLLIDAGKCDLVDTSGDQGQIDDHLGRFISATLVDSTVGAIGQGERHFITAGGAHIPTWYRLGPLLELEGVAELLGFHLARQLQGKSIDLIIPWAEPGIQLGIRMASRLSADSSEKVHYVVPVKDHSAGGRPEISDLDEAIIEGKRVLLLIDVLCAGETIRRLADEVDRCGGYVISVAGILGFSMSQPLRNVLGSIKDQNSDKVMEWMRQRQSSFDIPPIFDGVRWLSEVPDPVYPDAGQCRDCNRGKPYELLWSSTDHSTMRSSYHADEDEIDSQPVRSTVRWSQFWLGAQEARSIGQLEHQVACSHCHDGQVLDISRLREATDLWDKITQWAREEIEKSITSRSPEETEAIYLITSPSRGSTILAGELVRQYDQLQGPHIVARDPHTRLWGSKSSLPAGRECVIIDDSIFNTDTVTGMITYAERNGCQVVGILSILYCARGDDHYELVRTLKRRGIPLSAAFVAALQWSERGRCDSHSSFELIERLSGWTGWSAPFRQWSEKNVDPLKKHLESADTIAKADLLIGRMFRRRQREWDPHLSGRLSEEDQSFWLQTVEDWNDPEGPFELGPEFAVASSDFGASLDPTSAIRLLRQLLQGRPNPRLTIAISDLINGLPLSLCRQQHEGLAELFGQYRGHQFGVDLIAVALFKALWDVNLGKERWLYQILTQGVDQEFPLYGSVLATVMADQRTSGEIRATIRQLQSLRDQQSRATASGPQLTSKHILEMALRDLDHYRKFLENEAGGHGEEVAILTDASNEISVRDVQPSAEGYLAANSILVDFRTSQLFFGGELIPTKKRYGFDSLLSLAGLVCLHPTGITTGNFGRFLESRQAIADPTSSARQALMTLRDRSGTGGPFLSQKIGASSRSPWRVRVSDGWKWVILDSPAQNNLASLRAFVQALK